MKNEENDDKSERYEFIHLSFGGFLAAASLFYRFPQKKDPYCRLCMAPFPILINRDELDLNALILIYFL